MVNYTMLDSLEYYRQENCVKSISDTDESGLLKEIDSIDYFYRVLDQVFDRTSLNYILFAHKYGLEGLETLKLKEIAAKYEMPFSNVKYHQSVCEKKLKLYIKMKKFTYKDFWVKISFE